MKIIPRKLFVVGVLMASSSVYADDYVTQQNVNLGTLGSHDGNAFYFNLKQGFSTTCQYGLIYCPSSNMDCKNRLAVALAAKTLDKAVEVRYNRQTSNNSCTLVLMSIN